MRVPSRLKDKALGLLFFFSRCVLGGFLSAQPEVSAELLAPLLEPSEVEEVARTCAELMILLNTSMCSAVGATVLAHLAGDLEPEVLVGRLCGVFRMPERRHLLLEKRRLA
jgi:hypothetical protein